MNVRVDRCVCHGRLFEDVQRAARACGATSIEALQQEIPFGTRCGLCRPYVRRMLETGQVVFYEVLVEPRSARP